MCQPVFGQDALNCPLARRRIEAEPLKSALNRTGTDKSVAGLWSCAIFQNLPDFDDGPFNLLGSPVRGGVWSTRMVCKRGLRVGLEHAPPFVKPLAGAMKVATDIADGMAL